MGLTKPRVIDLRAEVRSRPTPEMWAAMQQAEMGWSTRGEDEDVRQLEVYGAQVTGKDASVFVATTSIANLLALMITTRPGDQVIIEADSHMVWLEGRNLAAICSAYTRTISSFRGEMALDEVEAAITTSRYPAGAPQTALIALENPHNDHGGTVLSPSYMEQLGTLAARYGSRIHLDGARLHNAAVAKGIDLKEFTQYTDLVSLALNKGVGAPMGSLLCGTKSDIAKARKYLSVIGAAGMHRAGLFAAAALVALQDIATRLREDHRRARTLAGRCRGLPGIELNEPETNQVRITTPHRPAQDFTQALHARGVLAALREPHVFKLVLYHEIDDKDVEYTIDAMRDISSQLVESGSDRTTADGTHLIEVD